jgi:hypothetical protein
MHHLTVLLQTDEGCSALELHAIQLRRRGTRLALDAQGRALHAALFTTDDLPLLTGAVAELYEEADGTTILRRELVAVDAAGQPCHLLPANLHRPIPLTGPVSPDELLGHVITSAYRTRNVSLQPDLQHSLLAGDIYRLSFRLRPSVTDTPAFLLANHHGIFVLVASPITLSALTRDTAYQPEDEEDEENDPWWDDELLPMEVGAV